MIRTLVSLWQPDATKNYSSADHTVKSSYEFNSAGEVLLWNYSYPTSDYTFGTVEINSNPIKYNFLNLPELVSKGGNTIHYTYDAAGRKLAETTTFGVTTKRTDYIGELMFEDDVLQFISHDEGRISMIDLKLIYSDGCDAISAMTAVNANLIPVTQSGQSYIKITSNGTSGSGVFPIGASISVIGGERYKIRLRGYHDKGTASSSSNAYLRIKINGLDVNSPNFGPMIPSSIATSLNESWIEQTIVVPSGGTSMQVGVTWDMVSSGEVIYLNQVEIIKISNSSVPEYQYYIKDHLGNIRVTFTSKVTTCTYSTDFESSTDSNFRNYSNSTYDLVDHTDAGTTYSKVQLLNGGGFGRVGLAKSIPVMPGDQITASAYVKYMNLSATGNANALIASLANAFGVSPTSVGDQLKIYDGLNGYANAVPDGDHTNDSEDAPKAFVTILFFDTDYNFVDAAWDQVSTIGAQTSPTVKQPPHDLVTITAKAKEAGYAFIFLSNEHPYFVDVYFDDVTFTSTSSGIISMSDYYPFGLTFNSWIRESTLSNNFGFESEENQTDLELNWLSFAWRNHQPDIGRFFNIDPLAGLFYGNSPYAFAENKVPTKIELEGLETPGWEAGGWGIEPVDWAPAMDPTPVNTNMTATEKIFNGSANVFFGTIGAVGAAYYCAQTAGAGAALGGGVSFSLCLGEIAVGFAQIVDGASELNSGKVNQGSENLQSVSTLGGLAATSSEHQQLIDAGFALAPGVLTPGNIKVLGKEMLLDGNIDALRNSYKLLNPKSVGEFTATGLNAWDAYLDIKGGAKAVTYYIRNGDDFTIITVTEEVPVSGPLKEEYMPIFSQPFNNYMPQMEDPSIRWIGVPWLPVNDTGSQTQDIGNPRFPGAFE